MVAIEGQSSTLLTAITAFVNLVVAGGIPDHLKPTFFGGRLIALSKKDGGIRPIVVGLTLRRLTSKLVNSYASDKLATSLAPIQLGVGVRGGVEAAVHAARIYVNHLDDDSLIVKLDFRNAFNTIRRDRILEAAASSLPEVYFYIYATYAASSHLIFDNHIIESAEGVQQGDPLGPLLFCLAIQPLLSCCQSELKIGYLDDITLGGKRTSVVVDIESLRFEAEKMGLALNDRKCEVIATDSIHSLPTSLSQFALVHPLDSELLGSPLLQGQAMDRILDKHVTRLRITSERLGSLQSHDALMIIKYSLSLPKLLHNLRSSCAVNHAALSEFDELLRESLRKILNVTLDDEQWIQATLPVNMGGLGIRRAHQVAPSAFLASISGAALLMSEILPHRLSSATDPFVILARDAWTSLGGSSPPTGSLISSQHEWDKEIVSKVKDDLFASAADDYTRARLLAVSSPHAGDWLNAPPITAVGLRMSNEAIRVATGLRLGANLCTPHVCRCGSNVDARGNHGLACARSAGRHQRHSQINDIVHRALGRAGVAAMKEPNGLVAGSSLRPDGVTLIPWARGKCLAWDATTPDTLATSHLSSTSSSAGSAAAHASAQKNQKYSSLAPTHHFVTIAVETLGPWNAQGLDFIKELGRRTSLVTGDPRESSFLLQRISVAVQLGNSTSFAGSLPAMNDQDVLCPDM
jgi:hypothetical protein